ncbi:hypothetical protein CALVIDRAFT_529236 [Calocera viscosa TUFC12733]|uniref:Uncharacterized protein n=1 Tax=Calocera viscosa (strain TUFC12733) TaxID=1330018 RepID=A0A167JMX4_CALVF|nr:hypothetical protein CALVIDRAFT_529236 [Calocera viscosa TUFC12733]
MDSPSPASCSSSAYAALRPSPLRARSSSIALKPLALAQLSNRPRSSSNTQDPASSQSTTRAQGQAHDEMGIGYTLVPPSPPSEQEEEELAGLLKEAYALPPVALAIEGPSSVYEAALGGLSSTRSALGRLWTHKRHGGRPRSKLAARPAPIPIQIQIIPLDVLTPPPSPPPTIVLPPGSLPLPASSPTTAAFALSRPLTRARITSVVLLLATLFFLSTATLLGSVYSLPVHLSGFPTTLEDLNALAAQLRAYADSSPPGQVWSGRTHTLAVLAYALLWSNAWSVPGSIILNVLTGVLLSPLLSTLYLTTLTALGSALATALTLPAIPLLPSFTLSASSKHPGILALPQLQANHLLLLRLSGVAPWSLLNIYAALHHTPFTTILWTCMVGCAPWCAVTAQIGSLLADLGASGLAASSVSEVLRRPGVIVKLVSLSLLGGAPVLMKGWVKGWLNPHPAEEAEAEEAEAGEERARSWGMWAREAWRGLGGYEQVAAQDQGR